MQYLHQGVCVKYFIWHFPFSTMTHQLLDVGLASSCWLSLFPNLEIQSYFLFVFIFGDDPTVGVKRPTVGSSCDIISPGEHSLSSSIFPWLPTAADADSHLDSGL